jgi:fatty acid desaturase
MEQLTHREFLATLSTAERRALLQTCNRPGLLHLSGHWGVIVLLGGLIGLRVPFWPLLLPLQGIALVFTFTLMHETVHNTPFRSKWLNRGVGQICSWLLILPYDWFRYFHLAHHKYTNDPLNDPELAQPRPETRVQYWIHISGLPTWKAQISQLAINAFRPCKDRFVPAPARGRIMTESRAMFAAYLLLAGMIALGQVWLLRVWLLPLLLGQPVLRLYLLAEHGRCPPVADMFENSRTVFTNALVRFFSWNMPYHAEHHAYPSVPFHKLPELHRKSAAHLKTTCPGYRAFHMSYLKPNRDS